MKTEFHLNLMFAHMRKECIMESFIIAMRQRRRFQQCRQLGLTIARRYKRIASIRVAPQDIQEELIKIPHAVEEDSSYEADEVVVRKYKRDPLKYIIANDPEKMELIKSKRTANRYTAALKKIGLASDVTVGISFHRFKL